MKMARAVIVLFICVFLLNSRSPAITGQEDVSMREKILSANLDVAIEALEESKKGKNVNLVCLSLKHPETLIKVRAVAALDELRNKTPVPSLIEALRLNQGFHTGGAEEESFKAELNRNIVSLLQKLTGLNFRAGSEPSEAQIKQIIRRSSQWWAAYQRRRAK